MGNLPPLFREGRVIIDPRKEPQAFARSRSSEDSNYSGSVRNWADPRDPDFHTIAGSFILVIKEIVRGRESGFLFRL